MNPAGKLLFFCLPLSGIPLLFYIIYETDNKKIQD